MWERLPPFPYWFSHKNHHDFIRSEINESKDICDYEHCSIKQQYQEYLKIVPLKMFRHIFAD